MGLFYMSLYAVAILMCFSSATSAIGGNETDRLALLEFKSKITDDPLGVTLSWNATTHFCHWYGVTCGHRHQRVKALDLRSLKLKGSISPHIGNMSFLRNLTLQNNSFSQEIPPEIGRLRRLHVLQLFNNSLGGTIPSNISACINLLVIDVANNKLLGEIPLALGRLPNLQILVFHHNNLTGSIPPSLGNLSSLVRLSIAFNNLVGIIPNTLGQLKNLRLLSVFSNRLSGIIPPSIFNLSHITVIDVGVNQIQGNLPSDIGITLPNLQILAISNNHFKGTIPVSISNASNLEQLQVVKNGFTGEVPSLEKLQRLQGFLIAANLLGSRGAANDLSFLCSLTNVTSLDAVTMDANNFGGALPECMSNFTTSLRILSLQENHISGSIPTWIGNLINLEVLAMLDNQFSGHILPSIGRLKKLQVLFLSQNNLSGSIPSSLGNLSLLTELYLDENNLQGSIPSSLGNCRNLLGMDLSQNNLSGAIPSEVMSLSSLSLYFYLYNNRFTGALPKEVGNLKNLGALDVSDNMLSGDIPSSLGGCMSLEYLRMRRNLFEGQIPSSLSSLRGLQVLDFSRNNFSGEIPEFLTSFDLKNLNLSYNNFEGMVPIEGIFTNASATSVMGNSKLCGGIPEFQLPVCNFQTSKKRRLTLILKVIISIISGLLGVFLVLSFLLFFWFKKKRKELVSTNFEKSLSKVSYQNLLKATDRFSSANLIGVGSFGSVYKGILDQDEMIIAVKVFNILRQGASKSFITECEALRNIRHRNLVKVLTACSGVDYHGNDFKALVYDFMSNGSLDDWLHRTHVRINEADEASKSLNLLQRLNIAIDIACALEYLHHHCETPIVHCDLKPSNVLLDDEMTGHVSDFGLAKLLSDGNQNNSTNQSSSIGLRGTIGYAPPEYGIGSEMSTYGDVYSYGILLLEMFTGKRPTDDMFKADLNLHNFVKVALTERVAEIADPILLQERVEVEINTHNVSPMRNNSTLEYLISIFGIGISCSVEFPRERMIINDAAAQLYSIKNKLLKTRLSHQRQTRSRLQSTCNDVALHLNGNNVLSYTFY